MQLERQQPEKPHIGTACLPLTCHLRKEEQVFAGVSVPHMGRGRERGGMEGEVAYPNWGSGFGLPSKLSTYRRQVCICVSVCWHLSQADDDILVLRIKMHVAHAPQSFLPKHCMHIGGAHNLQMMVCKDTGLSGHKAHHTAGISSNFYGNCMSNSAKDVHMCTCCPMSNSCATI